VEGCDLQPGPLTQAVDNTDCSMGKDGHTPGHIRPDQGAGKRWEPGVDTRYIHALDHLVRRDRPHRARPSVHRLTRR
jgi:hypothetical protein